MGRKKQGIQLHRKAYVLFPCFVVFATILVSPCLVNFSFIIYNDFLVINKVNLVDNEARDFLLNEFKINLPEDISEIHVRRNRFGRSSLTLHAQVRFDISPQIMRQMLGNELQCTTYSSFDEIHWLNPESFQLNNPPDWWQPENANTVLLQYGCSVSKTFYEYKLLINTDDSEMWIAYISIYFP